MPDSVKQFVKVEAGGFVDARPERAEGQPGQADGVPSWLQGRVVELPVLRRQGHWPETDSRRWDRQ